MSSLSTVEESSGNLGRFGALLVVLLVMFVVAPFLTDRPAGISRISILYTIVMIVGAYAVSHRRRVFYTGLLLASAAISLEWLSNFVVTTPLILGNLALVAIFVAYVAGVVFYEVIDEVRVTPDTIAGGIAIYLLIGVGWVLAYSAIEYLEPGSYLVGGRLLQEIHPEHPVRFPEFMYFSFVTMTTLGYGDIVPTNPPARAIAAGEAVVGQLYIAVFVARLVGLHLAHQTFGRRD